MDYYLSLILVCFLILNSLIAFFVVVNERRQPEKTLIWIIILLIFGPIGFISYIFFGRDIRRSYIKKHTLYDLNSIKILNEELQKDFNFQDNIELTLVSDLVSNLNFCPIMSKNKIEIFSNGLQKFTALKSELLKAKHHIHLEYFIVKDDVIGNEIKDILIKKSLEGVKIRFIIDKIGSHKLSKNYIDSLRNNNIEVLFYSYMSTPFFKIINTQINYRNHRKIVVIDGLTSFTGGINIGDEYLGYSRLGKWRDTHLMIKGECSLAIQDLFIDDYLTLKKLKNEVLFINEELDKYFPELDESQSSFNTLSQIIKSGPNLSRNSMILPLIKIISMAKKTIKISTPYFIPSTGFLNVIKTAVLSGVEVIINFPGKPDHNLVYYASRTYLSELCELGCKIYFYDKACFLHSKFIIVDDYLVTVGSTNMDIRSFELNHELNLIIYDKIICKKFLNDFTIDINNSTLANNSNFKNISRFQLFYENIARLFSSLL